MSQIQWDSWWIGETDICGICGNISISVVPTGVLMQMNLHRMPENVKQNVNTFLVHINSHHKRCALGRSSKCSLIISLQSKSFQQSKLEKHIKSSGNVKSLASGIHTNTWSLQKRSIKISKFHQMRQFLLLWLVGTVCASSDTIKIH